MKPSSTVPVFVAGAMLAACGALDAKTGSAPALASIQGTVVNPDSLPVNGSVRVRAERRALLSGAARKRGRACRPGTRP